MFLCMANLAGVLVPGLCKRQGIFCHWRVIAVMAILLPMLTTTITPITALTDDAPLSHYEIQAKIDYVTGALSASETVTYYNDTGQTLNSIVFHITAAYFGTFELESVQIAGKSAHSSLRNETLEIPLNEPLAPKSSLVIQMKFNLTVPTPGTLRFGQSDDIIALGNWYPVLAPWRSENAEGPPGWSMHRYVDTGDAFFTAVADYDVTFDVASPAQVTIAHTGDVIKHDGSLWQFQAKKVRDFALALSTRYHQASDTVENTTVTVFYLPLHKSAGEQYLRSATECLKWFNAKLFEYPYSTFQVAETSTADPSWVGQEYPNLVFIADKSSAAGGGIGSYIDYLVVHETAHQWFYGLVGNDQVYQPWVDEAIVTYISYRYFHDNYPQVYDVFWQRSKTRYSNARQNLGDRPVNGSIYDYTDENYYFAIVYSKGALFLDDLQKAMGEDAFFDFLRNYIRNNLYGIATANEVFASVQAETTTNIAPIVSRYFTYSGYQPSTPVATGTATQMITPSVNNTPLGTKTIDASATSVMSPTAMLTAIPSATTEPTELLMPTAEPTATSESIFGNPTLPNGIEDFWTTLVFNDGLLVFALPISLTVIAIALLIYIRRRNR